MVDNIFSRVGVGAKPLSKSPQPTSGGRPKTGEPARNVSLNYIEVSIPNLTSSKLQFASSQGRKQSLNTSSLSPDSVVSRSIDQLGSLSRRRGSPTPSCESIGQSGESRPNTPTFVPATASGGHTKDSFNMDHLRRRSSFAIDRLTWSNKGPNTSGSTTPTSPSPTITTSGFRSASPASPTSSPLNQSHSLEQVYPSISASLPAASPSSSHTAFEVSPPIKNVKESDLQDASAHTPKKLYTFQGTLSSDPKVANRQLLQSVQKYHRGTPDCSSPFAWKRNGRRHHAYPREAVPYPLAVDREALDQDVIDNIFLIAVNRSVSLMDFSTRPKPRLALDIGCGNGSWITTIAPEWPECHFVGFDRLPLQSNVSAINPSLAKRVEWVDGNFLELPMPFQSEYFDYVHVKQIGKAVPEDKWDLIIEEIARILKPGGAVEIVEEDILFPHIPPPIPSKTKKFQGQNKPLPLPPPVSPSEFASSPDTQYHHTRDQSVISPFQNYTLEFPSAGAFTPASSSSLPLSSTSSRDTDPKGSLDQLGKTESFSSQSSISPGAIPPSPHGHELSGRRDTAFSTISTGTAGGHLRSPSPPSPPLPPLPAPNRRPSQMFSAPIITPTLDDQLLERLYFSVYERRFINLQPTSLLASLLNIHFKKTLTSPPICRYMPTNKPRKGRRKYVADEFEKGLKDGITTQPPSAKPPVGPPHAPTLNPEVISKLDPTFGTPDAIIARVKVMLGHEETGPIHLYRVLSGIMACKEAMWDELMFMNGWTDADFETPDKAKFIRQERTKFDNLLERYRTAVQSYFPFREAVESKLGWKAPKREFKLTRIQMESLGEYDDGMKQESDTEDEGTQVLVGLCDNEDDEKYGRMYRRIRLFCAFKAESTES